MSQPNLQNSYVYSANCSRRPRFTLNTFTVSQPSKTGNLLPRRHKWRHRGIRGRFRCTTGGTGGRNRSRVTLNSHRTLNIVIFFPWCQQSSWINSNWSVTCALQVCQERQSAVRSPCAIHWRDTNSSFPKGVYDPGCCLLLYQLCQQLINAWQSPTYSKILMTCRIVA